jgi:hypothetical protein
MTRLRLGALDPQHCGRLAEILSATGRRGDRGAARVAEFYGPADDRVICTERLGPHEAGARPAQPSTS